MSTSTPYLPTYLPYLRLAEPSYVVPRYPKIGLIKYTQPEKEKEKEKAIILYLLDIHDRL